MKEYKVIFTGTMGAGKTTAIASISETAPIVTDVLNTDTDSAKKNTTVGMDFGQLTLDNGDRIRLFGTPGQLRFEFMWRILAQNALGLIILIDNSRPNPIADLDMYLDNFAKELETMPCSVGIGRMDNHTTPSLDDFAFHMEKRGLVLPVLPVDVRKKDEVVMLLDTMLAQLELSLTGHSNAG